MALAVCLVGGMVATPEAFAGRGPAASRAARGPGKAKQFWRTTKGKLAVVGASLVLIVGGGALYNMNVDNAVVQKRNNVTERWGAVQTALQHRYDTLTNQLKVLQGQAKFESKTQTEIAAARSAISRAKSASGTGLENEVHAAARVQVAMQPILTLQERYPELRANEGFQNLMKTIENTNAAIHNERRYYNSAVNEFNTYIGTNPQKIFVGKQKPLPTFEASEAAQENPDMTFDFGDEP